MHRFHQARRWRAAQHGPSMYESALGYARLFFGKYRDCSVPSFAFVRAFLVQSHFAGEVGIDPNLLDLTWFQLDRRRVPYASKKALLSNREPKYVTGLVVPECETLVSPHEEITATIFSKRNPARSWLARMGPNSSPSAVRNTFPSISLIILVADLAAWPAGFGVRSFGLCAI